MNVRLAEIGVALGILRLGEGRGSGKPEAAKASTAPFKARTENDFSTLSIIVLSPFVRRQRTNSISLIRQVLSKNDSSGL